MGTVTPGVFDLFVGAAAVTSLTRTAADDGPESQMAQDDDPLALEHAAWGALSDTGEAAAAFYAEVLANDVLVLLPGGLVIDDRDQVIDSMRGAPWNSFEIEDEQVLHLTDDSAVVAYRATARRDGDDYTALFNSTYVREDGGWKLVVHQQTPI